MPESLPAHLKWYAERSFRRLLEQIDGVTAEEALRDRLPAWPDHEYGIGQNGSIAGIVYHVTAWKWMTLPMFAPGGKAISREEFDPASAQAGDDWPSIVDWLKQIGTEWNAQAAAIPDAEFDSEREWFGSKISISRLLTEMLEHDIQHAAQIEYLRSRQTILKRMKDEG